MVPLHAQVTWPFNSVGVSVIVLPVIAASPAAVAVTNVPFQATPLTYLETWELIDTEAAPGNAPNVAVASVIAVFGAEAAKITSVTLARTV